jgi:predicted negative regulator of RcsB-dependent stress response
MAKEKQTEVVVENTAKTEVPVEKPSLVSKLEANPKLIGGVLVVVLLAVVAYFGYRYMQGESNAEAQAEMYKAELYFDQDSLDKALKGDKTFRGLQDIADEFGGTPAGQRAALMAGIVLLKNGKFEDAISYLSQYDGDDFLYKARAKALIGDAYMELNQPEEAANYYSKAADIYPTEQFTPRYLLKLGMALESAKDYINAVNAYSRITKEYPKSAEYQDARKYLARADRMSAE